jgi:N6-L-threonylcarbamoyladenine synthase
MLFMLLSYSSIRSQFHHGCGVGSALAFTLLPSFSKTTMTSSSSTTTTRWITMFRRRQRIRQPKITPHISSRFSHVVFMSTKATATTTSFSRRNDDDDGDDGTTSQSKSSTEPIVTATTFEERKSKRTERAKDAKRKRSQFIGLAKAVDRGLGQYQVTYQPGHEDPNGTTVFTALSGLPEGVMSASAAKQGSLDASSSSSSSTSKLFTVLGIESSCDDTGAAVVRSDGVILGEGLASQESIHEKWGGVVPGLAQEAHETNLDRVINEALAKAGMTSVQDVDAIGVTVGPGLEICLRVGCNRARELAMKCNKPFVGVHHLEAHILMARMDDPTELQFPFMALLVSGGHCQIMKCMGIGRYEIIGGTMDDSLGEAFDKTARLLGLPVGGGGGPAVEKLARQGNATAVPLTIPLSRRKDCDFSYAGLKTNVRRAAEQMAADYGVDSVVDLPEEKKADIAASFQNIAIKHLEQRLDRAMKMMMKKDDDEQGPTIDRLALVGGVAANMELRNRLNSLCETNGWKMVVPPPRLCTDQGAMAAYAAIERLNVGSSDDPSTQQVFARYPFFYYGNHNQADKK